jgi:hypothetical protein
VTSLRRPFAIAMRGLSPACIEPVSAQELLPIPAPALRISGAARVGIRKFLTILRTKKRG